MPRWAHLMTGMETAGLLRFLPCPANKPNTAPPSVNGSSLLKRTAPHSLALRGSPPFTAQPSLTLGPWGELFLAVLHGVRCAALIPGLEG